MTNNFGILFNEEAKPREDYLFNEDKNFFNEINKIITEFDLERKLGALLKLDFTGKDDFINKQTRMTEILKSYTTNGKCANGFAMNHEWCKVFVDDKEKLDNATKKDIETIKEIKEAVDKRADFTKNWRGFGLYTVTLKEAPAATEPVPTTGGKKRKSLKKCRTKRKSLKKRGTKEAKKTAKRKSKKSRR